MLLDGICDLHLDVVKTDVEIPLNLKKINLEFLN